MLKKKWSVWVVTQDRNGKAINERLVDRFWLYTNALNYARDYTAMANVLTSIHDTGRYQIYEVRNL